METQARKQDTCCGGPAILEAKACCRKDELAMEKGKSGCGCTPDNKAEENTDADKIEGKKGKSCC